MMNKGLLGVIVALVLFAGLNGFAQAVDMETPDSDWFNTVQPKATQLKVSGFDNNRGVGTGKNKFSCNFSVGYIKITYR